MFVRLKLTTMEGREFLSPFVYLVEEGEKKLKKLGWLRVRKIEGKEGARTIKSGKLELVEVKKGDFPTVAFYHKQLDDMSINAYIRRIKMIEEAWKREVMKHEERERERENNSSTMDFDEDRGEGSVASSYEKTPRLDY